jgi:VWFA-related protein
MRFYAAALAVLLAIPAAAQFKETLEVRLLEIEATVLDAKGHPVENLIRDDFVVTLDGKAAEITNFSLIRGGAVPENGAPIATRVVIFIDDVHLHPDSKQHAIAGIKEYIARTIDEWTTVTVVTWNTSLHTRMPPTNRPEPIVRALDAIARELPLGMSVEGERRALSRLCSMDQASCAAAVPYFADSQAKDAERTIEALREVIASIGGLEGRKSILYVSEGLPMLPGVEMFSRVRRATGDHLGALALNKKRELRQLAHEAQDKGIVFNTIDPTIGLGAASAMNPYAIDYKQIRDNARQTGQLLARETGGRLITDRNDLHLALAELDEQVSTYYSMAVRAPNMADEAKVQVRLKGHPELRVLTATRRSLQTRESHVSSAVRAQLYERRESNPLEARLFIEMGHAERCIAAMNLLVPKARVSLSHAVDVRLAVLDQLDQESDVYSSTILITPRHGAIVGQAIPVLLAEGGRYVLSVALIDRATGVTSYLQRDVDCSR